MGGGRIDRKVAGGSGRLGEGGEEEPETSRWLSNQTFLIRGHWLGLRKGNCEHAGTPKGGEGRHCQQRGSGQGRSIWRGPP